MRWIDCYYRFIFGANLRIRYLEDRSRIMVTVQRRPLVYHGIGSSLRDAVKELREVAEGQVDQAIVSDIADFIAIVAQGRRLEDGSRFFVGGPPQPPGWPPWNPKMDGWWPPPSSDPEYDEPGEYAKDCVRREIARRKGQGTER